MPFLLSSTEVLRNRYIWTNWDATSSKKKIFFLGFPVGSDRLPHILFYEYYPRAEIDTFAEFHTGSHSIQYTVYLCESGRESQRSPHCSWRSGFDSHCERIETECCPHRPVESSPKPVKHIP